MNGIEKRISFVVSNRTLVPVLVPMFLIISSGVYPAIISSIENKEMQIISKVMAQLLKDETGTNDDHSILPTPNTQDLLPFSPTLIDPVFSAASSTSLESNDTSTATQQQDEDEDIMAATLIDPGDLIHVLWDEGPPGDREILYKRDGAVFDPTTTNLSDNTDSSDRPAIAASGDTVHVVWRDGGSFSDILHRRSTDRGGTFGPITNLSANTGFSNSPAIAVSGNNVYVVWVDNNSGNVEIIFRRSTDGGASFTEPVKNLSSNLGISEFPAIAAVGNSIHVVWQDNTSGNADIFYRRSVDGGATFPNVIKNLSGNAASSQFPAIAAVGNSIHVVWQDDTPGNFDILYRRSLDGGSIFSNIIENLSISVVTDDFGPAVAALGTNVFVVWQDGLSPDPSDILFRLSTENGATFDPTITNLSVNSEVSGNAVIAAS